ncbi:MAG TPA: hypothetical protein VF158_03800 [Longimicrobiales bacterium]
MRTARGRIDADAVLAESVVAIERAGADMIIPYRAEELARRL